MDKRTFRVYLLILAVFLICFAVDRELFDSPITVIIYKASDVPQPQETSSRCFYHTPIIPCSKK